MGRVHYRFKLIWMKIICWNCEWYTNPIIKIYTRRVGKLKRVGSIWKLGISGDIKYS